MPGIFHKCRGVKPVRHKALAYCVIRLVIWDSFTVDSKPTVHLNPQNLNVLFLYEFPLQPIREKLTDVGRASIDDWRLGWPARVQGCEGWTLPYHVLATCQHTHTHTALSTNTHMAWESALLWHGCTGWLDRLLKTQSRCYQFSRLLFLFFFFYTLTNF